MSHLQRTEIPHDLTLDDLIDEETDKYSITLLTKAMEEFQDKGDKWSKIECHNQYSQNNEIPIKRKALWVK